MAKKPSETLDEKIIAVAVEQLATFPAISHLRVKATIDRLTGDINEPAVVWRALANCEKFAYSRLDNLFRRHQ